MKNGWEDGIVINCCLRFRDERKCVATIHLCSQFNTSTCCCDFSFEFIYNNEFINSVEIQGFKAPIHPIMLQSHNPNNTEHKDDHCDAESVEFKYYIN